jgi:hypothetical protein
MTLKNIEAFSKLNSHDNDSDEEEEEELEHGDFLTAVLRISSADPRRDGAFMLTVLARLILWKTKNKSLVLFS